MISIIDRTVCRHHGFHQAGVAVALCRDCRCDLGVGVFRRWSVGVGMTRVGAGDARGQDSEQSRGSASAAAGVRVVLSAPHLSRPRQGPARDAGQPLGVARTRGGSDRGVVGGTAFVPAAEAAASSGRCRTGMSRRWRRWRGGWGCPPGCGRRVGNGNWRWRWSSPAWCARRRSRPPAPGGRNHAGGRIWGSPTPAPRRSTPRWTGWSTGRTRSNGRWRVNTLPRR